MITKFVFLTGLILTNTASTIRCTGFGYPPQAARSGAFFTGADVVGDEQEHGGGFSRREEAESGRNFRREVEAVGARRRRDDLQAYGIVC